MRPEDNNNHVLQAFDEVPIHRLGMAGYQVTGLDFMSAYSKDNQGFEAMIDGQSALGSCLCCCGRECLGGVSFGKMCRAFDTGNSGFLGNASSHFVGMVTETVSQGPCLSLCPFGKQAGAQMDDIGPFCLEDFCLGYDIVSRAMAGHDTGERGVLVPGKSLFFILQAGETSGHWA
jgi:hypothetical protein